LIKKAALKKIVLAHSTEAILSGIFRVAISRFVVFSAKSLYEAKLFQGSFGAKI